MTNFGLRSAADKADELESNSSAPSVAACSAASSSQSLEHDSISHAVSSASGVLRQGLISQHAALSGAGRRGSSSMASSQDSQVASASFLGAVPVHQQQKQFQTQEARQPCAPCPAQSLNCLPSHASSQHCSGRSLEYAGWECPQLGWALSTEASSSAADSSGDPSCEESASYAALTLSEVGRVYNVVYTHLYKLIYALIVSVLLQVPDVGLSLGDDLFNGLSWDSAFSSMQPIQLWTSGDLLCRLASQS